MLRGIQLNRFVSSCLLRSYQSSYRPSLAMRACSSAGDAEDLQEKYQRAIEESKEIRVQLDKALADTEDIRGKYQRAIAETENVRRRGKQQVEDAKVFAIQSFSKDLLEVADVLDLAVDAVDQAALGAEPKLKNLYDGVVMTKSVLHKAFNKHGLTIVSPDGEKFDPNLHDALFKISQAESKKQAGYVEQVLKIGYSLHGRPIRAAQVAVVQ